jgi:hypothetical protein
VSRGLTYALACALCLAAGCGGASSGKRGPGLSPDQVRPALSTLPYTVQLRDTDFPNTKASYLGTAQAKKTGARVDFTISICDERCPTPAVHPLSGVSMGEAAGGTGWAYLGNGTAALPGQTPAQARARVKMDAAIFGALCDAAHEITCV